MYAFSVNAKTREDIEGFEADAVVPFIVYINFLDLFGAEQLCKLYLVRAGFYEVTIDKRKLIEEKFLSDQRLIDADKHLADALNTGYAIQLFEAH